MKRMQKLVLGVLSLALAGIADAGVLLVKDGQAVADIVVDTNALSSVKLAAEDLQKHLELMSGAKLPIVSAPSENVENHVYVGPSEYTRKLGVTAEDLKVEGFKIIAKGHDLVLIGHDEQRKPFPFRGGRPYAETDKWQAYTGEKFAVPVLSETFNEKLGIYTVDATATLYASSELLEQLGVRFYNPYENGTVVPEKKTIEVAEQNLRKEPKFPYREFCYYGEMRDDVEGVLWFKRLKYGASYVYLCNHTTIYVIGMPEQREAHPEYYAMANGKRIQDERDGVPRLSDPGFRKTSIKFLNKVFEAYPPIQAFSLGMPDGFTQIDERDAKVWDRPGRSYNGKFSDYVWDYWLYAANELKKTHPDKYLSCTAYTTYLDPPSQVGMLPDNVTLGINYNTGMEFPTGRKQIEERRSKWLAMLPSKRLYIEDFFLFYRQGSPRYPVFFTKALQEDMQNLAGVCEGKFVEIAPSYSGSDKGKLACIGLTHLLHYWQGKLYWDPDMDRQKMLNEYYDLYFGPARAEMKEFYEFAEEVWMRPETRSISMVAGFLKEKDVDRYFEILRRAREKAGKNSVYDKRIAQIETEMQPLKTLLLNLKRTGPDFQAYVINQPFTLDGNLEKPLWKPEHTWLAMRGLVKGETVPNAKSTLVSFRIMPDKSALVVAVKCFEPAMDKIRAKTKHNDDFDIFEDDAVEIYIETPERSYFKIVVNAEGKIWDESQDVTIVTRDTLPTLWNPGVQAVVKKEKDRWTAEIVIPTKDFGALGPDKANPWGINVCRYRLAGNTPEDYALSPTGTGSFCVLSKLGNLRVE